MPSLGCELGCWLAAKAPPPPTKGVGYLRSRENRKNAAHQNSHHRWGCRAQSREGACLGSPSKRWRRCPYSSAYNCLPGKGWQTQPWPQGPLG